MTDVKIIKKGNSIMCVECIGHTDYSLNGEDIVCAALSSVVQTAVLGILSVAKINGDLKRDDVKGYLKFTLPAQSVNKDGFHDAQVIFNTMLCGISDLREGYSDYINLEVVNDVY